MENIKISRDRLIDFLLQSWADHYEMMDDQYLILEYRQYFSEDPDYAVTIELEE